MISIVMPVFNSGKYLEDSIGSVLNQKYADFELIIIDDSSTDEETLTLLEEYKYKDFRIRLYRSDEHLGAARARNWGISLSKGEYLIFLDSDDFFDEELLMSCFKQAEISKADIVVFNYAHSDSEHLHDVVYMNRPVQFYQKYSKSCFDFRDYSNSEVFIYAFATGTKFLSRDLIIKEEIVFQDIKRQNDIFFSLVSMLYAKRVIFSYEDKVLLHARDHGMSERVSNIPRPFCGYYAICGVLERVRSDNKLSQYAKVLSLATVRLIINGLFQCLNSDVDGEIFYNYIRGEGIGHLDDLLDLTNNVTSVYYKGLRNAFALDYDSKWWLKNDYMNILNISANSEVLELLKEHNQKTMIFWGIGPRGVLLLRLLRSIGVTIHMVVDKSCEMQGRIIEGYKILSPEKALNVCDLILTGNAAVRDYIKTEISWSEKQCVLLELVDDMLE